MLDVSDRAQEKGDNSASMMGIRHVNKIRLLLIDEK
jgi:hypothetical protein